MFTRSRAWLRCLSVSAAAGALVLGGLVAVSGAAPAHAFDPSCDPAGPALSTLRAQPATVNVKQRTRTLTLRGTTTGDPLRYVSVQGVPVSDGNVRSGYQSRTGSSAFTVKVTVPKGSTNGVHRLELTLGGENSTTFYSYGQLAAMPGVVSQFTVVSNPDRKNPTLQRITLSANKVDTTRRVVTVSVTARAGDKGGAGLVGASLMMRTPSGRYF